MKPSTLAITLAGLLASTPAFAMDWTKISGHDMTLFYPGQASYEWVLTPGDHSGGTKIREGKNCHECHTDEESNMGDMIAAGKKKEPTPIPNKPGSVIANVKFAHDDTNMYVHLQFKEGNQPDAKQDPKFSTKVTMILDAGGVKESNRFGCWGACHDNLTTMPSAGGATDRTMYLSKTRAAKLTREGAPDGNKPADELAQLKASGYELEYWQAKLNPGAKAEAVGGTIFDKREEVPNAPVTADASFSDGVWSVTLSRPLKAAAPFADLEPGKTYTIGFAIHSGHTAHRFHYVSLERTMVVDQGTADFIAAHE
jgi:cytochrome c-type protein NapC